MWRESVTQICVLWAQGPPYMACPPRTCAPIVYCRNHAHVVVLKPRLHKAPLINVGTLERQFVGCPIGKVTGEVFVLGFVAQRRGT